MDSSSIATLHQRLPMHDARAARWIKLDMCVLLTLANSIDVLAMTIDIRVPQPASLTYGLDRNGQMLAVGWEDWWDDCVQDADLKSTG